MKKFFNKLKKNKIEKAQGQKIEVSNEEMSKVHQSLDEMDPQQREFLISWTVKANILGSLDRLEIKTENTSFTKDEMIEEIMLVQIPDREHTENMVNRYLDNTREEGLVTYQDKKYSLTPEGRKIGKAHNIKVQGMY